MLILEVNPNGVMSQEESEIGFVKGKDEYHHTECGRYRYERHGPASFRADLGLELGSNPPLNLSSNLACKHRLKCVL